MSEPSNRDAAGSRLRDVRRGCVTLRELTVGYRERVAVEAVSGVFAMGSLTAIVGANGAGKTTLLHAIAGLVAPRHGSIEIAGADPPADLAYLPQSDSIDRDFPISVLEFAALGGWARIGALGRVPPELRSRGMNALQAVGLDELAGRMLGELSVGQFRRALFARVIVQEARDRPSRRAVRRRRRGHERRPAEARATLAWRGPHGDRCPARPRAGPRDLSGDPLARAQGDRLG